MIYDCFTFFNELDLLEIRLNILNEVVDKFVLVEATRTHRGNPKPLYFVENKQRFAPFLDKIIHVVVDSYEPVEKYIASKDSDPMLHSWAYENFQRHSIIRGLDDLKDNDVLIVSDLDEIPSAEAVRSAAKASSDGKIRLIQLSQRNYYLNFCNHANPLWTLGPIVLSGKSFKDENTFLKTNPDNTSVRKVLAFPSPHLVRTLIPDATVKHGGWHFSYMGGLKMIQQKLKSFSHSEFSSDAFTDESRLSAIISRDGDLFGWNDRYYAEPPEKCLPRYILDNLNKYRPLIYKTDCDYQNRTKWSKRRAKLFYHLRTITPSAIKQIIFRMFFAPPKK